MNQYIEAKEIYGITIRVGDRLRSKPVALSYDANSFLGC